MSTSAKPDFVYVTYIKTTREALWDALTDSSAVGGYWTGLLEPRTPKGEVLIADRPNKLSYAFRPDKLEGDTDVPPSRVTFTLEPAGEAVKLTLVQDRFDDRSSDAAMEGKRWPVILSRLKSMMETDGGLRPSIDNSDLVSALPHEIEGRKRVFVTYIQTTAERLWQALTDGEETKRYFFGRRIASDWKAGSSYGYWLDEGHGLDVSGEIKEIDPPYKLVITWQVVWLEEFKSLPAALVTYQIDPLGPELVRFTVIEEIPEEVPEKYLEGGKQGWPRILSGLKSLLEVGSVPSLK